MTKKLDDLEMPEDLGPDVCPEGISQAMLARNFRGSGEHFEIDEPDAAAPEDQTEFERRFGSVIGQLMTDFLKY